MIVIDKNVMVPMTDGVRLATDAFRLQEAPPSPVLLVRTPYGKDTRSLQQQLPQLSCMTRTTHPCSGSAPTSARRRANGEKSGRLGR
jgi:predicted acyl esterase